MRAVTFLRRSPPYAVGETAGFDDRVAEMLIEKGIAAPFAAPSSPPVPEAAFAAPANRAMAAPRRRGRRG